jgi:SAM-dependent methyltransferase
MSGQTGQADRPRLLGDDALEQSAVVANIAMNRVRGLAGVNSYERELGFDPYEWLADRAGRAGRAARPVAWLDVCCGSGRALLEAERRFADELPAAQITIVGVDLVDFFAAQPHSPRLELIAKPAAGYQPDRPFDLVTCVHGLHYIGDKLDLISRLVSFLTPGGLFAADFDPESILNPDGTSAARKVLRYLRESDIDYDRRRHRITCTGPRTMSFPATYRGADDLAGPGYTGQPAVCSYYQWP